jgi:hypothetical protein
MITRHNIIDTNTTPYFTVHLFHIFFFLFSHSSTSLFSVICQRTMFSSFLLISLPATLSFSHRQLLCRRRRSLALTGDHSLLLSLTVPLNISSHRSRHHCISTSDLLRFKRRWLQRRTMVVGGETRSE